MLKIATMMMNRRNNPEMTAKLYDAVGERIRKARTGKVKLTQKQLAHLVGLNRTSIAKIEAGEQRFTLDTLYLLALSLEVPVTSLLPKLEKMSERDAGEKEILKFATAPEGLAKKEMESILNAISEARAK